MLYAAATIGARCAAKRKHAGARALPTPRPVPDAEHGSPPSRARRDQQLAPNTPTPIGMMR